MKYISGTITTKWITIEAVPSRIVGILQKRFKMENGISLLRPSADCEDDFYFPAGLLRLAISELEPLGYALDLTNKVKDIAPKIKKASWLDANQQAAIIAATDYRRGVIKAATGAGKGEIAVGLMHSIKLRWLYLAPSSTLTEDICNRVTKRTGKRLIHIKDWDGEALPDDVLGLYATYQYLRANWVGKPQRKGETAAEYERAQKVAERLAYRLGRIQGVICDECHVIASKYGRIVDRARKAQYRIGLSATPFDRADGANMIVVGTLGPKIYELSRQESIASGRIVDFKVLWTPFVHDYARMERRSDWPRMYRDNITHNAARNLVIAKIAEKAAKPTIIFCERIEHAHVLAKMTNGVLVTKDTSKKERLRIIEDTKAGKIDVLVSTKVFTTGIDIPILRSAINAGGLKAVITLVQKIGRVFRAATDKEVAIIHDIEDTGIPVFHRHTKDRKKSYGKL